MNIRELTQIIESFLPYEEIGTIIKKKDGYNILSPDKEIMIDHSYPSLKRLLSDLLKYGDLLD